MVSKGWKIDWKWIILRSVTLFKVFRNVLWNLIVFRNLRPWSLNFLQLRYSPNLSRFLRELFFTFRLLDITIWILIYLREHTLIYDFTRVKSFRTKLAIIKCHTLWPRVITRRWDSISALWALSLIYSQRWLNCLGLIRILILPMDYRCRGFFSIFIHYVHREVLINFGSVLSCERRRI